MKVLISAGWYGGPGGAQRALHSMLRALDGDDVTVVARHQHPGPLSGVVTPVKVMRRQHPRWRGSASTIGLSRRLASILNPARKATSTRYDVYLQLFQGADLNSVIKSRVRLLVPSGNVVSEEMAAPFDHIAMQAPDNAALVPIGASGVLLPPPLYPPSESASRPPLALPPEFHLTVFNPYHEIKGSEDLRVAATESPIPVVWCYSNRSLKFDVHEDLREHPNIIHAPNLSPSELRWLYESCVAYLCFSRTEGFGWSIADGLRYSRSVVSREIGLLTYPEARQPGVIIAPGEWAVDWASLSSAPRVQRSLDWLAPVNFRRRLLKLSKSGTP